METIPTTEIKHIVFHKNNSCIYSTYSNNQHFITLVTDNYLNIYSYTINNNNNNVIFQLVQHIIINNTLIDIIITQDNQYLFLQYSNSIQILQRNFPGGDYR